MNDPDFSVVVPVFNAGRYVERCVRALLTQTWPAHRYEIILVDNNSTDDSAAIIAGFERVTLLFETEQSSYAARNLGWRSARGKVVVFTDPDCEPQADWLEEIARAMEFPNTGLILGERKFADDSGTLGMLAAYETALNKRIFGTRQVGCYYAYTNNMAVRMPILEALGGFQRLKRGADSLFFRQALTHFGAEVFRYAPAVLVRHLEIERVRDYLEKKRIYGQVNQTRRLATPTALPFATRLELAFRVQREQGASLAARVGFLGVLAAGAGQFEWQRRRSAR